MAASPTEFDPYHKWLGIPPEDQPPNHYRLLAIPLFESDTDVIANAADKQMAHVRSFQMGKHSQLSQKILNEIAAARICLLNAEKKADYDAALRARQRPKLPAATPLASPVALPTRPSAVTPFCLPLVVGGLATCIVVVGAAWLLLHRSPEKTTAGLSHPPTEVEKARAQTEPEPKVEARSAPKAEPKIEPKAEPKPETQVAPKPQRASAEPSQVTPPPQGIGVISPASAVRPESGSKQAHTRDVLVEGKFGKALKSPLAQYRVPLSAVPGIVRTENAKAEYDTPPLTIELWIKANRRPRSAQSFLCNGAQRLIWRIGGWHWGEGDLLAEWTRYPNQRRDPKCFTPKEGRDSLQGDWHYLAVTCDKQSRAFFVDGMQSVREPVQELTPSVVAGPLFFGGIVPSQTEASGFDGLIDEVRISKTIRTISAVPAAPFDPDGQTIGLWHFDEYDLSGGFADSSPLRNWAVIVTDQAHFAATDLPPTVRQSQRPPLVAATPPPSTSGGATEGAASPTQVSPARLPLPDKAAEKKARDLVKEVFGADYAAAKGSPDKLAGVAKAILQQAAEAKDAASRYVLLDVAKTVSVDAGDAALAFQALDEIDTMFQIDGVADTKREILESLAKKARSSAENTVLMKHLSPVLDEFVANDNFEAAKNLGRIAVAVARKTRDAATIKSAIARNKEIEEAADVYATDVNPALATLKRTPTDPAANLVVGKWWCFSKDDWAKGLPMLVLGDDAALKEQAEKEIAGDDKMKAADGWWALSQKEPKAKQQIQTHAASLYQEALPGLSGLEKKKAEQRLVEAVGMGSKPATKRGTAVKGKTAKKSSFVMERKVKIIAASDGADVYLNDVSLTQVRRGAANTITATLKEGDILASRILGRFDVMNFWMVFLTEDDQYLFETSTDWTGYLPPDQERWWDVKNQTITQQQKAVYTLDTREYVREAKKAMSQVTSSFRIGQPICSPLQNTQPVGKEIRPAYLPTYVYYVVSKSDLLPKKKGR